MKLHFNVAGPCIEGMHYMIPPARRLPEAPGLVEQSGYFVIHAPRQTGKTTFIRALAEDLTAAGKYAALYFSYETAEAAGDDFEAAERAVLSRVRGEAALALPSELQPPPFPDAAAGERIIIALGAWSSACPRPVVLFFDEIDALRGQSLITVLRQLRAGFSNRPRRFPASVILCGMRDVRDYKAASDPQRLGTASPFNVKLESICWSAGGIPTLAAKPAGSGKRSSSRSGATSRKTRSTRVSRSSMDTWTRPGSTRGCW